MTRNSLRSLLRRRGVGTWLMRNFYQPTLGVRWLLSLGAGNALRLIWGESAMKRRARRLPPIAATDGPALAATYMTGAAYWHQTVFGAWSLARHLPKGLRPTFYDDGSLTTEQRETLQRVFPQAKIVSAGETQRRLDIYLPAERFPLIRATRAQSVMLRKFVDLRVGSRGWQLYLDSDMLFFQRPALLEDLAVRQETAVHMVDHVYAYALPTPELDRICGVAVRPRVNAGIVGLDDRAVNWEQIEQWFAAFPPNTLTNPLFEQTITAMVLSHLKTAETPAEQYRILYDSRTPPPSGAVLLHYIFHAKTLYFSKEWRRVLRSATSP